MVQRFAGAPRLGGPKSVSRRMMMSFSLAGMLAVGSLSLGVASPAQAASQIPGQSGQYRYQIFMEGRPIGTETVAVTEQGDKTRVEVTTQTDVSILFFSFHYDHHRIETWQDGQLTAYSANTNDDGDKTALRVEQAPVSSSGGGQAAGWFVQVNDQPASPSTAGFPLSLWTQAVTAHSDLFSVIDGEPYRVSNAVIGSEQVTVSGRQMTAEHISMTGDMDRELWFDDQGILVRATFTRKGYPIEIIRQF